MCFSCIRKSWKYFFILFFHFFSLFCKKVKKVKKRKVLYLSNYFFNQSPKVHALLQVKSLQQVCAWPKALPGSFCAVAMAFMIVGVTGRLTSAQSTLWSVWWVACPLRWMPNHGSLLPSASLHETCFCCAMSLQIAGLFPVPESWSGTPEKGGRFLFIFGSRDQLTI